MNSEEATNQAASYRRVLKASSTIGGASVINILIGLLRTKALAVLLGPSGLGLVSLYTALMSTAATMSTMGIGTVGTRQIAAAAAAEDARALAVARKAMFWGSMLLATAGGLTVWALRNVLAVHVLGGVEHAHVVGWLALGVALSVASASQGALIQGMRRIGDMARLSILGSLLSTVTGVALIFQWGIGALWAFILVAPFFSFVLGHVFVARLPKAAPVSTNVRELALQWKALLWVGVPFMGAALANVLVQLWIRVSIGSDLGLDAVGHFQAATAISLQYIGFVLGAMGADYFPRLSGVIHDKKAAVRLVNEQTEIALLLSAPVLIAMLGLAPWVIALLYTPSFAPAVEVLRWQILADLLKVASWPMGFVLLAAGAGKTFFWSEVAVLLVLGGLVALFASSVGLKISGIAYLVSYAIYLPLVYFLAAKRIGLRWTTSITCTFSLLLLVCVLVSVLSSLYWWGYLVSIVAALIFGRHAIVRLAERAEIPATLKRLSNDIVGSLISLLRKIKS